MSPLEDPSGDLGRDLAPRPPRPLARVWGGIALIILTLLLLASGLPGLRIYGPSLFELIVVPPFVVVAAVSSVRLLRGTTSIKKVGATCVLLGVGVIVLLHAILITSFLLMLGEMVRGGGGVPKMDRLIAAMKNAIMLDLFRGCVGGLVAIEGILLLLLGTPDGPDGTARVAPRHEGPG